MRSNCHVQVPRDAQWAGLTGRLHMTPPLHRVVPDRSRIDRCALENDGLASSHHLDITGVLPRRLGG